MFSSHAATSQCRGCKLPHLIQKDVDNTTAETRPVTLLPAAPDARPNHATSSSSELRSAAMTSLRQSTHRRHLVSFRGRDCWRAIAVEQLYVRRASRQQRLELFYALTRRFSQTQPDKKTNIPIEAKKHVQASLLTFSTG